MITKELTEDQKNALIKSVKEKLRLNRKFANPDSIEFLKKVHTN
jgi:hypothetical protein